MTIHEKDSKIVYDGSCFTVFLLKTPKEVELEKEIYKIGGYYSNIYNAIKFLNKWRLSDKYPFKESEFSKDLNLYLRSLEKLNIFYKNFILPYSKAKETIYLNHKLYLNEHEQST